MRATGPAINRSRGGSNFRGGLVEFECRKENFNPNPTVNRDVCEKDFSNSSPHVAESVRGKEKLYSGLSSSEFDCRNESFAFTPIVVEVDRIKESSVPSFFERKSDVPLGGLVQEPSQDINIISRSRS
ncbi:hypothetical protein ACOSQ3_031166 [Xanthoceras sorbifolium]